jgi:hypothetical protein
MLVPVADVLDRAVRVAGTAPWLAIGALAGVTGGLAVFVGLVRRRHATVGEEFLDRLRDCDRVTVLTHPNPDPDALGAGLALAHLADAVGVESTLQYPGEIRHQENWAFRTVLSVDCERVDHVSDLAAEAVVLVDHNEPRGFAGAGSVLPSAVLDHHPGDGEGSAFTDVRTDYGATASPVAEYLDGLGAVPVPSDSHATEIDAELTMPSTVATALTYPGGGDRLLPRGQCRRTRPDGRRAGRRTRDGPLDARRAGLRRARRGGDADRVGRDVTRLGHRSRLRPRLGHRHRRRVTRPVRSRPAICGRRPA